MQAIDNNEWEGNDLLMAELSYEKALPYARTNFVNEGIGVPKTLQKFSKIFRCPFLILRKTLKKTAQIVKTIKRSYDYEN